MDIKIGLAVDLDQVVADTKEQAEQAELEPVVVDPVLAARQRATAAQQAERAKGEGKPLAPSNAELMALIVALYDRVQALEKPGGEGAVKQAPVT